MIRRNGLKKALKEWMLERGRTNAEVAKSVLTDTSTITRILNGETKRPHPRLMRDLYRLIGQNIVQKK